MTTHYVDYTITLPELQSGEISHLLGRLWQRLHGVLAAENIQHLGISLPRIRPKHTGNVLRLHSDSATLQQVRDNSGIRQLVEMAEIRVGAMQPTPDYCAYRSFTRNRTNEKLTIGGYARSEMRWLKHLQMQGKPITIEALLERRERFRQKLEENETAATAVYLRLTSASTHQQFSLMIQASVPTKQAQAGKFSHYGLAVTLDDAPLATVPWFE